MMMQPLMTRSIRYGLRAVMTYDQHPDNPLSHDGSIRLAAFNDHHRLSRPETCQDPREFLRELLAPHNPEAGKIPEPEWGEMSTREMLRRFPYPGVILPITIYKGGPGCTMVRTEGQEKMPWGGTHIGWAYMPPEHFPDGGAPEARNLVQLRMSELERYLNGEVFRVYLEEDYQRRQPVVGDIYNYEEKTDPSTGEISTTARYGYPAVGILEEALAELLAELGLTPREIQDAAGEWRK